jgi:hypothetical protein
VEGVWAGALELKFVASPISTSKKVESRWEGIIVVKMPPKKEEFKPKPSAKSEKNKPKGGKAKDEQRAKAKAKEEAKKAAR